MSDMSLENQMLVSVPVRPLAKGMHRDKIAQLLEAGAMTDVRGYRATPYGLETDECFVPAQEVAQAGVFKSFTGLLTGETIDEFDTFTDSAGAPITFALSTRFIYTSNDLVEWIPVPYVRTRVATSAAAGQKGVVDSGGALVLDKVAAGMYAAFPLAAGGYFTSRIAAVPDATHLVLDDALPSGLKDGLPYSVYAPFGPVDPIVTQYAKTPSFVLVVDGTANGIHAFDGHFDTPFVPWFEGDDTHSPICGGARTVAYIAGRVLLGGTTEPTGRRRWRWSSAVDLSMFNVSDYCDATSAAGAITRIAASEDYPVIFLDDGLIVGQPWGMDASSTDPWLWRPIASGGAAPVGPRAWVSVPGQIFFLGPDDVYAFSPLKRTEKGDYVVQPTKCAVRDLFIGNAYRNRTIMRYDPFNARVVVAFPDNTLTYKDIFSWNFGENEWSHRGPGNIAFTTIALFAARIGATWKNWLDAGYVWNDGSAASQAMKRSWLSWATGTTSFNFIVTDAARTLYIGTRAAGADRLVDLAVNEIHEYALERVFETGDLDLGLPDEAKSFHKFALRTRSADTRAFSIDLTVEGSTDRGRTWRTFGDLHILPGEDEDEVHFAMRGTTIRFRVTSRTADAGPWTCEEYTVRVRRAGRQIVRGSRA